MLSAAWRGSSAAGVSAAHVEAWRPPSPGLSARCGKRSGCAGRAFRTHLRLGLCPAVCPGCRVLSRTVQEWGILGHVHRDRARPAVASQVTLGYTGHSPMAPRGSRCHPTPGRPVPCWWLMGLLACVCVGDHQAWLPVLPHLPDVEGVGAVLRTGRRTSRCPWQHVAGTGQAAPGPGPGVRLPALHASPGCFFCVSLCVCLWGDCWAQKHMGEMGGQAAAPPCSPLCAGPLRTGRLAAYVCGACWGGLGRRSQGAIRMSSQLPGALVWGPPVPWRPLDTELASLGTWEGRHLNPVAPVCGRAWCPPAWEVGRDPLCLRGPCRKASCMRWEPMSLEGSSNGPSLVPGPAGRVVTCGLADASGPPSTGWWVQGGPPRARPKVQAPGQGWPCCPRPRLRVALGQPPRALGKMEAGLGRGRGDKAGLCGLGPERRPGPCPAASEGPVSPAAAAPAPPRGGSEKGPVLPSSFLLASGPLQAGPRFPPCVLG